MGRGLSCQQKRILALAVAHNAARREGVPKPETLVMYRDRGYLDGEGYRTRVPIGFALAIPDLTEQLVLASLYGFAVWPSYRHSGLFDHWCTHTVRRGKRVSTRRAISSLIERGFLVQAWPVEWMPGLGFEQAACEQLQKLGGQDYGDGFNGFWWGEDVDQCGFARAFWLTPKSFELVGDLWRDFADDGLLELFWKSKSVREMRGLLGFWEPVEVEEAAA